MIDKEKIEAEEPEQLPTPSNAPYDDESYDDDYFPDYDENEAEYDDF